MTVSHLFYGGELIDADINYEQHIKSNKTLKLGYDLNNSDFKELLKMMALGSKANFSYFPSDEEIVAYCKREGTLPSHKAG